MQSDSLAFYLWVSCYVNFITDTGLNRSLQNNHLEHKSGTILILTLFYTPTQYRQYILSALLDIMGSPHTAGYPLGKMQTKRELHSSH